MARKTIYKAYNRQGKLVGVSYDKDELAESLAKGTASVPPRFADAPTKCAR